MPSEDSALAAESVSFAYDRRLVVDSTSLAVAPGDGLALAGPNGSGKTTLLKLLSGDLTPQAGTVELGGRRLADLPARERARRIGVVPQHLDPGLTFSVRSIVSMGRTPHGGILGWLSSRDHAAIDQAMRDTDTHQLADRRFDELSGGERQRVMLALALAQESDFLLLDEPTVHLDLQHQHELLALLLQLRRNRGLGLLAVVHDLNLAALYFDRLAMLSGGKLVDYGQPGFVLERHKLNPVFKAPLTTVLHPTKGVPQVLLNPEGAEDAR